MDDASPLDPDVLMLLTAAFGVATGKDREAGVGWWGETPGPTKALFVGFAIVLAWSMATSPRGFLYCLLMPIGAYKLAQVVSEPVWAWWRRRRSAIEAAQLRGGDDAPPR